MPGARPDPDPIAVLSAAALRALATPARLEIVHLLGAGPAEARQLAAKLGLSQPDATAQLTVLRRAGLVEAVRDGRQVRYRLVDDQIAEACELLRSVLLRRIARLVGGLPGV